jgi:DNA-binding transcriptional LysR family regulator
VRGLVAAGVGVAILPRRQGGPVAGSIEIPIAPTRYRMIGLIVSARRRTTPAAESFRLWAASRPRPVRSG